MEKVNTILVLTILLKLLATFLVFCLTAECHSNERSLVPASMIGNLIKYPIMAAVCWIAIWL